MEVKRILLPGKCSRLAEAAAKEAALKNFKKYVYTGGFRKDLHPAPAFLALRQVPAIRGNLGKRHLNPGLRVHSQKRRAHVAKSFAWDAR